MRIEDLPAALRFVRDRRGVSLRDVEAVTGIGANTLNRLETGKITAANLQVKTAERLARWIDEGE